MNNQNYWYDKSQVLSYQRFLTFVIGNRGGGKTFNFKKWCIDDFIKTGAQFVWVRRFNTEITGDKKTNISGCSKSFFSDIKEFYPNNKLTTKGNNVYIDDKLAGYFIALSTSDGCKSTPYPLVNKMIFDEFLITGTAHHYLKNEVDVFLDLISTIKRQRENFRVVCIANAVSFANPYFMTFGIKPFQTRFYIHKTRPVIVEMWAGENYTQAQRKSQFGQLVAGTKYGDFAIENKFLYDSDKFIEKRNNKARFRFAIRYNNNTIGFWLDFNASIMYACRDYDPDSRRIFTLQADDQDINLLLIKHIKDTPIQEAVFLFQNARLRFSDIMTKAVTFEILANFI